MDTLVQVEREVNRRPELTIDRRLMFGAGPDMVPALIVSGPWGQGVVRNLAELEARFGSPKKVIPSGRTKQTNFLQQKQLKLF